MDDAALKQEIENDPTGVGYAKMLDAGQFGLLAEALNTPRDGTVVGREIIPAYEFVNAIVADEYAALGPDQHNYFTFLVSAREVNVGGGAVRQAMRDAFPEGSTTRKNLEQLFDRKASRAEFVVGQAVTFHDCVRAVRGGL